MQVYFTVNVRLKFRNSIWCSLNRMCLLNGVHLVQFSLLVAYVSVNSKTTHAPPGQTPGHLTFLKNCGQIPRYVASLDGQMSHPLELQRGSNPPPSRHVKKTVETNSAKFSATTNFLFSLSSLHTLNKGIFHDRNI